jgi:hypothetical protein
MRRRPTPGATARSRAARRSGRRGRGTPREARTLAARSTVRRCGNPSAILQSYCSDFARARAATPIPTCDRPKKSTNIVTRPSTPSTEGMGEEAVR